MEIISFQEAFVEEALVYLYEYANGMDHMYDIITKHDEEIYGRKSSFKEKIELISHFL